MRAVLIASFLALGCAPSAEVIVEIHTDLEPGVDFDLARARILGATTTDAARASGYLEGGVRLPALLVPPGPIELTAALELGGATVVTRAFRVRAEGTVVVPVWLVRACTDLECPSVGAPPSFTECDGGRCVEPACVPTDEECAPPACLSAADCPPPAAACAETRCERENCVLAPRPGVCDASEYCNPDLGCRPRTAAFPDAGTLDVGPRDVGPCVAVESACGDGLDEDCDGMRDCVDPDCAGRACDDADLCTHTDVCGAGACRGSSVTCTSDTCAARSCNGTSNCTVAPAADGTPCAADLNLCTYDSCVAGACVAVTAPDNAPYDDNEFHRCCGGVPVELGSDGNCAWCGDDCGGYGCGLVLFVGFTCNCPGKSFCADAGRGNCFDGFGADGLGLMCQCQDDGDCRAGQTCCFGGGPAFRHVCRFGPC